MGALTPDELREFAKGLPPDVAPVETGMRFEGLTLQNQYYIVHALAYAWDSLIDEAHIANDEQDHARRIRIEECVESISGWWEEEE